MANNDTGSNGFDDIFVTAPDGLKLHVRSYGPRPGPNLATMSLPVVCLPGLARTAADFHDLAAVLGSDPDAPRRVFAIDYRGRGLSDYDRDPRNYNLKTELADLLAVLTALGVGPAVFVGTSRGGILAMLLASIRPTAIAGVVLNDIGPVIEPSGLARIKSYVGKLPRPKSFEEGAEILRRLFGKQFTKLTDEQWLAYSHRSFKPGQRSIAVQRAASRSLSVGLPKARPEGSPMEPTYDVQLAKTLRGIDFGRRMPPLWNEFDALSRVPLMVLRGENSDLLSEATLAAMRERRGGMETFVVPEQGHAPILSGAELIGRIAGFAAACEPERPAA